MKKSLCLLCADFEIGLFSGMCEHALGIMQHAVIKMLEIIHINNQHAGCLCAVYIEWDSI